MTNSPERIPLFPLRTGHSRVPWLWVILFAYPAAAHTLIESISGPALTFTMKKFVSDPALITFLGSLNIVFNFLVGPWVAWKSDHIWTRFGRRRPFLMGGWALLFVAIICVPLAPNFFALAICVAVYRFCEDFGYTGPWTPLYYEMIPTHQRGRAVVVKRLGTLLARLLFNLVLIGKFDDIISFNWSFGLIPGATAHMTGELMIYCVGALAILLVVLQMFFLVRETRPANLPAAERFSPMRYVKVLFGERQWRILFLLMFCSLALVAGLGQLAPLLITEQFGYTKKVFGQIHSLQLIIELSVFLPLALFIADRFDRFRIFQAGLILSTLQPLCYWFFVKYVAHNGVPTFAEIAFFNLWNSAADVVAALALEPLIFDYVPRNMMGTINSGFLFVRGVLLLVMANGVGFWVKLFPQRTLPKPGYDYMSAYIYIFLVGLLGIVAARVFAHYRKSGALVMYGHMEEKAAAAVGE